MINYPKNRSKQISRKYQQSQNKFGLPKEIKFCKKCAISNQRPNSTIEFANKPTEKRKLFILMIKVFVTLVIIVKKKKILIGKKENLNFKNYAINIEKLMVNMIVLFWLR